MDTEPVAAPVVRMPKLPEDMGVPLWHDYDREGDRLVLRLIEHPVPAYSLPMSPYIALRVALDSGDVIGVEIERFTDRAIVAHPELKSMLVLIEPSHTPSDATAWKKTLRDVLNNCHAPSFI